MPQDPGTEVLCVWDESGHDYVIGKVVSHTVDLKEQDIHIMCHNGREVEATKVLPGNYWREDNVSVLRIYILKGI